ncbi:MAG TPA: hypothetical protein VE870_04005, partial [Bacteroidales bacterium]|nr:hypothetical protein [Bacteroidales bacterium]
MPGPLIRADRDGMFSTSNDSLLIRLESSDSLTQKMVYKAESRLSHLDTGEKLAYFQLLGNYYYSRENPDSAIFYNRKGLDIARKTGNSYYTAYFHLWIAINYNIKSEYETALNELTLASEVAAGTDSIRLQNTIARNTGNVYWGMGIYEKALE